MDTMKATIKLFGVFLPLFTAAIVAGIFYGIPIFQAFSNTMPFLVNSMYYIGASTLIVPFLPRNYGSFWHMILLRAVIPVIASSPIMIAAPFSAALIARSIYGGVMGEESMILLAFMSVMAFVSLSLLRAVYEIKHELSRNLSISVSDLILVLALLTASVLTTPFFLRYGDYITTEFGIRGYSMIAAFLVRNFLSAIPSAMFAVAYITMLHSDRIRLR